MTQNNDQKPLVHYKRIARELTLQYLFQQDLAVEDNGRDVELFWQQAAADDKIDKKTFRKAKNFALKLIDGVSRTHTELDQKIIDYASGWTIDRMAVVDRNLLRIAIFEMLHLVDVPPIVSIDEAVTIAREFSGEKAAKFINGILNHIKNDLDRPARRPFNKQ